VFRAIYCLCQWAPILTVCRLGRRHPELDSAKRRYLTEAVFPVYILHQTLIVCMAHWMKPIKLAPGIEGVFLIVLTFAISFGVFEVVRRVPVLRPLFGLGRPAAPPTSSHPLQELAAQR
jgi:surface polysaccharide O-acyltransferase-like enzyme